VRDGAVKGTAVALVPPGLESALVAELAEMGVAAKVEPGGAAFDADSDVIARVNRGSRLAIRVLLRVGTCGAGTLDELARGLAGMPWKALVVPEQPIDVDVSLRTSKLRKDAVEKKIALAIGDALRGPRLPGPRPPREPALISVRIEGNRAAISVDTSGERLTIRGWREATAKAPLRENLAAAVLRVVGWTPAMALVDPMCGSGTFVIEAARIAAGLPPRLPRVYAFERAPGLRGPPEALQVPSRAAPPLLWGSDRDAGGVKAATANAVRAKVRERVRFEVARFEDLEPPAPTGLLIANPPWGMRIGDADRVPWSRWGERVRSTWGGWKVALVVPADIDVRRQGWPVQGVASFESGGVRVRVVAGDVPPG
jgi:putative N6-adenine-specific DNA methylase